ncbi:putative MFS family arabinose efflux permease [Kribbella orskensis]|uniref:MFS family arabinose efflux permease n=1 Tax=Kribbella orskensis TaxID=2512216 RepID=A0ABY2BLH0_9ACTN|nr:MULTISPECIES: MFS transporter [Kribbella]TCN38900.1 putative MFS family arabinose efflux permease [Kribbella sp. VKM Ac-2500]TCO21081.1 putative MFS family arabinose efflux permease [Kribbella orskensis]
MESPDPAEQPRSTAGERLGSASKRLGSASKKVGQASKSGATGFASASRKTANVTGRFGKATGRRIRGLTGAQGAGESGLSRLIELGAVNAAGDTAFAVSLAGTVFFAVPSSQARDRVALFLVLTMAPFALMAPLIGPILDRFRHGRRWAIGATLGLRGFLVWSLAASIHESSAWLYPAALGCLVASKAYGVTRASAVPRLLPKDVTLVTANSRISLAGLAGATVGAGLAAAFAAIGPQWSLRWAAVVYTIGLILAIRLPSRVDSPAGEEMTGTAGRDARRRAITAAVARGIRCNLGLRFVSGFLTMYLAFLLRDRPISGIDGVVAAGAVIAAAGIGNSLGTIAGSLLKARKPETVVLVVLLADVVVAVGVAVFYGFPMLITLGLVAGLCSSLGKLSLDAMIQRDVPESVRTSVFARSETVLQLAWVLGGGCGILLPLMPRVGFGFLAAILVLVVVLVVRHKPAIPARGPRPGSPTKRGPGSPGSGGSGGPGGSGSGGSGGSGGREPAGKGGPPEPRTGTTRTILTSDPESIAERRANRPRTDSRTRYTEPTVELRFNPNDDDSKPRPDPTDNQQPRESGGVQGQAVGRWWSGQPDEDETLEDEAPWAADKTVENKQPPRDEAPERRTGPFRRRRSDPDAGSTRRPPR